MKRKADRPGGAAKPRTHTEVLARELAAGLPQSPDTASPEDSGWTPNELRMHEVDLEMQKPDKLVPLSLEESRWTLHELRVHQIELEMQNEQLRLSQLALGAARARYFELYDLAPVGYCSVSETGLILEANLTAAKLLGAERGALVGQPINRFIFEEDQDRFYLQRKQLVGTEEPLACELRMLNSDGAQSWVHAVVTAAQDDAGAPVYRVVLMDLSERKQAEQALRESELRWQFAVEGNGDAMWDWDAGENELLLTGAAKELFDLPDMGAKRPIADLLARVVDADRVAVGSQIDAMVAGRISAWSGEFRLWRFGESPRWIATRGRVMTRTADGRPKRIVSVSSDISQRKRKEDETQRQRELIAHQGRLVLLGELASSLVHEINQPLTAIAGFAAVCARMTAEIPEALELVRAIEAQAMRAGEIAWRMHGFARRQRIGRAPLSLHEIIGGVVKWMRVDSAYLDVVIDVAGVAPSLPRVDADKVELEQVLINLVRNGIEAALPGAATNRIAIAGFAAEQPGELEVTVTDWGCGMPSNADLGTFQPFNSSKEQGLGLGLSICFSIIEGHGGRLWATANPEGGTIFHFILPIAGETIR